MINLHHYQAKVCLTAAALLIHEQKVLFIRHKKLNIWFAPGGHVDPGEMPHVTAERECEEETGVKVKAFDPYYTHDSTISEYLPSPLETNLHWVSEINYQHRQQNPNKYEKDPLWQRGCEQHLGFVYLVKPIGQITLQDNTKETTGLAWFTLAEVQNLAQTNQDIKDEVKHAFQVLKEKGLL